MSEQQRDPRDPARLMTGDKARLRSAELLGLADSLVEAGREDTAAQIAAVAQAYAAWATAYSTAEVARQRG
jgi:hypothetical protein